MGGLLEPHILELHILELHILELHKLELMVEHIAELVVGSFGFLVELNIQPLVVHKLRL